MRNDGWGFVRALGRELVVAITTWIGALTALFVVYGSLETGLEDRARQQGVPVESMREFLPVSEGPVFAQWSEFVASYTTFDYGVSIANNEPVAVVFGQALGRSVTLLLAFVAVAAVLAVAALWVTTRLRPGRRGALTVPAYLLGVLAPIVGGVLVLWYGYATGGMPTRLTTTGPTGGGVNGGLLFVVSFVVVLPIVGDAVRRAHRESAGASALSLRSLLGPGRGGFGTIELWGYLVYLASSLVVVEYLFAYQGVGWYVYEGVQANDPTLVLGIAAGLAFLFVVLSLARNVGWIVAQYVPFEPGRPASDPAGTRGGGGRQRGHAAAAGDTPRRPRTTSLSSAVAGHRTVRIGGALLALATVLGFLGALVPVDTVAMQRPPAPGLTGGILLNTMGSIATGLLVASVVAVVLGVLPGLLAGALEGYDVGPGTVLSTVLRVPSEVAVVVPFAVAGLLYLVAFPPAGPGGSALSVGAITGLVLAGFAFRAVYDAARARIAARGPDGDWVGASLVAGVARLDFVAAVTVFVAGELTFLGVLPFGPSGPYLGFLQLNVAYSSFGVLVTSGGNAGGVLLAVVLATAPFAIGLYLVGDGLGAIAARFRASGVPTSPASGSPPTRRQSGGTQQSPPQDGPRRGQSAREQSQQG